MEKEGLWPYLYLVLFLCLSHLSAADSGRIPASGFLLVCISLARCSSRFITCLTEVLTFNLAGWCIEFSIKTKFLDSLGLISC